MVVQYARADDDVGHVALDVDLVDGATAGAGVAGLRLARVGERSGSLALDGPGSGG